MDHNFHLILILLLPFLGGVLTYVLRGSFFSLIGTIGSLVLSVYLLFKGTSFLLRFHWFSGLEMGWRLDGIGLALASLVGFIGLLVLIYSTAYFEKESQPRYFLKMGFFISSMLGLLLADHLLLMFIFWELVGFSSYLLIGFWYQKNLAAEASKWAFMVNRIADLSLLGGILALGSFDSFFLSELANIDSVWMGAGFLIGAMGKSAQFPFSAWLPRAMEGPTPVSALIHAATMVAAGVYLLFRLEPVMPGVILNATLIVGAASALYGAMSAITQHDVKQVLAYSTISQLGFMFMGIGSGHAETGFFHLWTHAFFKAGLFLIIGLVIHRTGTQDMRKMGGHFSGFGSLTLLHVLLIFSLVGIPLFAGFLSKEGILSSVFRWSSEQVSLGFSEANLVFYMALFTIMLTGIYGIRQVMLIYFRKRENSKVAEVTYSMRKLVPVCVLAAAAIWVFHSWNPFHSYGWIHGLIGLRIVPVDAHYLSLVTTSLGILGMLIAYLYFGPNRKESLEYETAGVPRSIMGKLSFSGWHLDAIYEKVFVSGYLKFSHLINRFDDRIVDGIINGIGISGVVLAKLIGFIDRFLVDGLVNLMGAVSKSVGQLLTKTQSPQIQRQILWLILALILILVTILFF